MAVCRWRNLDQPPHIHGFWNTYANRCVDTHTHTHAHTHIYICKCNYNYTYAYAYIYNHMHTSHQTMSRVSYAGSTSVLVSLNQICCWSILHFSSLHMDTHSLATSLWIFHGFAVPALVLQIALRFIRWEQNSCEQDSLNRMLRWRCWPKVRLKAAESALCSCLFAR